MGNHTFMFFILICTELLITVKFSDGEFNNPMSDSAKKVSLLACVCVCVRVCCFYLCFCLSLCMFDVSKG
jgi:hypothetical protein